MRHLNMCVYIMLRVLFSSARVVLVSACPVSVDYVVFETLAPVFHAGVPSLKVTFSFLSLQERNRNAAEAKESIGLRRR